MNIENVIAPRVSIKYLQPMFCALWQQAIPGAVIRHESSASSQECDGINAHATIARLTSIRCTEKLLPTYLERLLTAPQATIQRAVLASLRTQKAKTLGTVRRPQEDFRQFLHPLMHIAHRFRPNCYHRRLQAQIPRQEKVLH